MALLLDPLRALYYARLAAAALGRIGVAAKLQYLRVGTTASPADRGCVHDAMSLLHACLRLSRRLHSSCGRVFGWTMPAGRAPALLWRRCIALRSCSTAEKSRAAPQIRLPPRRRPGHSTASPAHEPWLKMASTCRWCWYWCSRLGASLRGRGTAGVVRGCVRGCWLYATWPLTAGSGHRAAGSAVQRREITRQQSLIAFIDLLTIVVVLLIAITVCRHVAVWLCGCVTHTDLCMLASTHHGGCIGRSSSAYRA